LPEYLASNFPVHERAVIETETCPKCGAGLSAGVLEGLCARCLAALALGEAASNLVQPTPVPRPAPTETGVRLFGDYELLKEVARGPTGVVYKARQISRDQIVAIKVLPFASDDFIRRFRAEAEAAAANLHHPNIVAIHEVGEQSGQRYYSMDFVEGQTLAALVKDHTLPAARAAGYLQRISQTIQYAHQSGILHRDLKPSNVIVGADDEPRVTDFELAKPAAKDLNQATSGPAHASPGNLAPELATGRWDAALPQSDVYALGAILYQLLTGRQPFTGETTQDTLTQVLNSEPVSPRLLNPATPRDLESICLKCLDKSPRRRFASAQELADELGRFLRHEPVLSRSAGAPNRFWQWCRRKPALAAALTLLLLAAAASTTTAISMLRLRRIARVDVYASDMNQAQSEWQEGNFAQAFHNLQRQIPHSGEPDLRGFEWRHLWKLTRGACSFKLPRHAQVVSSLMYSPDGKSLATLSSDKSCPVKIWDLATRRERFRIPNITSLGGFSANGRWLVVGTVDGSVAVHDSENGKFIFSIPRVGEIAAFAPAANSVVALDTNLNVLFLKLDMQRPANIVTRVTRRYLDYGQAAPLAITPDGHWLAVVRPGGGADREDSGIEIWNIESTNQPIFLPLRRQIRTLLFAPDGQKLAVGEGDGWVHLCNWSTMETRPFQAHELPILALAFSPDGRTLATGSSDENIQLWDAVSLEQKLKSFDGQIGAVRSLAFSPDGKFLSSGGRDSPVRLWNLEATRPVEVIADLKTDKIGNFTFSPDGSLMAGGCRDNSVRIWDVATMIEKFQLKEAGNAVAFTSDGKKLLAFTADGIAQWWDFRTDGRKSVPDLTGLAQVTSVDLSPGRRVAAIGRSDGVIQLLEVDSGKVLGTYRGHADAVLVVALAHGTSRFASGSRDKTIRLWDINVPATSLWTVDEQTGPVRGLAISNDGKMVVSGGSDETIKFWDLRRPGQSLGSIRSHQSTVQTLAFSPDNRILASGGEDKVVKLWDFARRTLLANYKFADAIRLVAFSPEGNNLAVVTEKGTLRLLRAVTLAEADEEYAAFYREGAK
jgi:eukaryotic-like serine/threonine-protein kinase